MKAPLECSFCKKNGEIEEFYRSHKLKDENDAVICPVLKKYVCPFCSTQGSHTASYCPMNKIKSLKLTPSQPILNTTPRTSALQSRQAQQANKKNVTRPKKRPALLPTPAKAPEPQKAQQPLLPAPVNLNAKGFLSHKGYDALLTLAYEIPLEQRLPLFLKFGYNIHRYEYIKMVCNIVEARLQEYEAKLQEYEDGEPQNVSSPQSAAPLILFSNRSLMISGN